ncbi:MAG: toprim domain-containing protein, partial [Pseudobdellovibrionaceae bacterium]|nr:toprim domain-containing protein [Pseudobdellovibrionaceae bacterium]
MISLSDYRDEIADVAAECGINWQKVSDTDMVPEKFYNKNVPVLDDKYEGRCSYIVKQWGDGRYSISFHSHKYHGQRSRWVSGQAIDPSKIKRNPQKLLTDAQRDARDREYRAKVYMLYQNHLKSAEKVKSSQYLERKKITEIVKHFDLRTSTDDAVLGRRARHDSRRFISYPIFNARGECVGFQRIYEGEKGDKRQTKAKESGDYTGAYAVIGQLPESHLRPQISAISSEECSENVERPRIYVTEGFATAASVFLATNVVTVIATSANNIKLVCQNLAKRYPDAEIVICADNDNNGPLKGNTGIYTAIEASWETGVGYLVPPTETKADFNDWHCASGLDTLTAFFANSSPNFSPKKYSSYLAELLRFCYPQKIPELAKKLAHCLKVGLWFSPEAFHLLMRNTLLQRYEEGIIKACVSRVLAAQKARARKFCSISDESVSRKISLETALEESTGHWVINIDAINTIVDALETGAIV